MSDMSREHKTFTVRDLSRETAAVLEVCAREGTVKIRTRSGDEFELKSKTKKKPEKKLGVAAQGLLAIVERQKALAKRLGVPPMTKEQRARLDLLIAGE
jgi:hypothetical protein